MGVRPLCDAVWPDLLAANEDSSGFAFHTEPWWWWGWCCRVSCTPAQPT